MRLESLLGPAPRCRLSVHLVRCYSGRSGGSVAAGTARVGFGTPGSGRDYRLGYGLGVLNRKNLNFELGVDAQRRKSAIRNGADHAVLG